MGVAVIASVTIQKLDVNVHALNNQQQFQAENRGSSAKVDDKAQAGNVTSAVSLQQTDLTDRTKDPGSDQLKAAMVSSNRAGASVDQSSKKFTQIGAKRAGGGEDNGQGAKITNSGSTTSTKHAVSSGGDVKK